MEENKTKSNLKSSNKVTDLENKIRKLELERDQLLASQDATKQRHKDELAALEASHK